MTKLIEATQRVTDLYSLRSLIITEHDMRCFAMNLPEMTEQSASWILTWTTR